MSDLLEKIGNNNNDNIDNKVINIPLSIEDISVLISLLNFTSTSAYLIGGNLAKDNYGANLKDITNMNRHMNNARVLIEYLSKHLEIGQPSVVDIH